MPVPGAEELKQKANTSLGMNVCLYDAAGQPIVLSGGTLPVSGGTSEQRTLQSGTLAAMNDAVTVPSSGFAGAVVLFSDGLVGTVIFEFSHDNGAIWRPVYSRALGTITSAPSIANPSSSAPFVSDLVGATHYRARCLAYTSGSCTVQVVLFQHAVTPATVTISQGASLIGSIQGNQSNTTDNRVPASSIYLRATGDLCIFNGTGWDRARGDIANGIDVDVTRVPSVSFPIDPISGSRISIRHTHEEIHEGKTYSASHFLSIPATATQDYLVITPNTAIRCHMMARIWVDGNGITISEYEGATVSANGTSVTAFNKDRNSANAATAAIYRGPTVTGTGTAIRSFHLGAGRDAGTTDRAAEEWVLKQNTIYLFRIVADAAQAANFSVEFEWYEI